MEKRFFTKETKRKENKCEKKTKAEINKLKTNEEKTYRKSTNWIGWL